MPDTPDSQATPRPEAETGSASQLDVRAPVVLLVEDQDEMRVFLAEVLAQEGYEVLAASNGLEAISLVKEQLAAPGQQTGQPIDLIITDYRMPGATGLELLEHVNTYPEPPSVILISAFADSRLHAEARQLGAVAILAKPFSVRELLVSVSQNVSKLPNG